jgi:hypothetical protein
LAVQESKRQQEEDQKHTADTGRVQRFHRNILTIYRLYGSEFLTSFDIQNKAVQLAPPGRTISLLSK